MLFAQIEHLSFMRVNLIKPNFGLFFLFMLGWTMILVMFKVSRYESHCCDLILNQFLN